MATFSERYGYKPVRTALQIEGMDQALRNGLWNALDKHYWSTVAATDTGLHYEYLLSGVPEMERLCRRIWELHLKRTLDGLHDEWLIVGPELRDYFFKCTWHEAYSFIEFVAAAHPAPDRNGRFMKTCNKVLEREAAGYRFVSGEVTRITDPVEIAAIEDALQLKPDPVRIHLQSALEKLSDRQNPDYRNSVKESISAVEAATQSVTGKPKATLEDALLVLKRDHDLHPALNEAFRRLYGWTGDAAGIRHALMDGGRDVTFEEAKFMLVACSAFVNLVLASTPATVKES